MIYDNYIGAKIIKARLSNLEEYKKEKWGTEAKINEVDSSIYGYIVIYPQIGNEDELPYMSWSPKQVFETCYRKIENIEIELILGECKKDETIVNKDGKKVIVNKTEAKK